MKEEKISYCKCCKLPKDQCQCTRGELKADYKTINMPCQDCLSGSGLCQKHKTDNYTISNQDTTFFHQHSWTIDKMAGFIKEGVEGAYIICRECGEIRLMEIKR